LALSGALVSEDKHELTRVVNDGKEEVTICLK
jgi:hypothetical protein